MRNLILMLLLLHMHLLSGEGLKCFSDLEGKHWTQCEEKKGYRTCFTKYNLRGEVMGRGCSTKDKIFHIECENHVMGAQSEKFCYCSYYLCNQGTKMAPAVPRLVHVVTTMAASLFLPRILYV